MDQSTTIQWALAVLWVTLLFGALYALAVDSDVLFQAVAWVAIALGTTMAALQLRRRRKESN